MAESPPGFQDWTPFQVDRCACTPGDDKLCSSHQNNALPLAVARGLGVIAKKVFADGAYYGKLPRFSRTPDDVILSVGKAEATAYADLVR